MSNVPLPRVKYLILSSETLVLPLKPVERFIFGFVLSLEKNNKQCFASNGYFAELLNVSSPTVQRAIARLVERGLLRHCLIHHSGTQRLLSVNTVQMEAEVVHRLQCHTTKEAYTPVPPQPSIITLREQLALEELAKDDAQCLAVQKNLDDVLGKLEAHRLAPLVRAAANVEEFAMRQMAEDILREHQSDVNTIDTTIAEPTKQYDAASDDSPHITAFVHPENPVDNSPLPSAAVRQYDEALAHIDEAPHHIDKAPHQNDVARNKQFLRENSYKKFIDHYEQRAQQRHYKIYQRNTKTSEFTVHNPEPPKSSSSFAKGTFRTSYNKPNEESSKARAYTRKEIIQYTNNRNGRAAAQPTAQAFDELPLNALFEWEGSGSIYGTFRKLDDTHALRLDINKVITIPNVAARAVLRE